MNKIRTNAAFKRWLRYNCVPSPEWPKLIWLLGADSLACLTKSKLSNKMNFLASSVWIHWSKAELISTYFAFLCLNKIKQEPVSESLSTISHRFSCWTMNSLKVTRPRFVRIPIFCGKYINIFKSLVMQSVECPKLNETAIICCGSCRVKRKSCSNSVYK